MFSLLRRVRLLLPLLLLAPLSITVTTGCGGFQNVDMDNPSNWEVYLVRPERLRDERTRLARVVREVLIHRRYFPESSEKLTEVGEEGKLMTHWNDDDARITLSSGTGYRYKVEVRIQEGLDHIPTRKGKTETEERYLESLRKAPPGMIYLTVGVGCIKEVNTRMNIMRGDYEKAEWEGAGQDAAVVARLKSEIRDRFRQISEARQPDNGRDGSSRTADIMRTGGDGGRTSGGRTVGPGDVPGQYDNDLDFGTHN